MQSEQPETCDCCMFETSELTRYEMRSEFPKTDVFKWLCALCAGSEAGTVFDYQYTLYKDNPDLAKLMGVVCNIGNHIIQELRHAMQSELDLKALREHYKYLASFEGDPSSTGCHASWRFILRQIERAEGCGYCDGSGMRGGLSCEKCESRRADLLALQRKVLK